MSKLLTTLGLAIILMSPQAIADDFDHFVAGGAIGGGIAALCKAKLKDLNGVPYNTACVGLGVTASIIAGAVFEMVQEDYREAGRDILHTAAGGVAFSVPLLFIEF